MLTVKIVTEKAFIVVSDFNAQAFLQDLATILVEWGPAHVTDANGLAFSPFFDNKATPRFTWFTRRSRVTWAL